MPQPKSSKSRKQMGLQSSKQASPASSGEEIEYAVRKILDHKTDGSGKTHYLISWVGYGPEDDTWEPVENLANAGIKLHEYWIQQQQQQASSGHQAKAASGGAAAPAAPKSAGVAPKAAGVQKKKKEDKKKATPTPKRSTQKRTPRKRA